MTCDTSSWFASLSYPSFCSVGQGGEPPTIEHGQIDFWLIRSHSSLPRRGRERRLLAWDFSIRTRRSSWSGRFLPQCGDTASPTAMTASPLGVAIRESRTRSPLTGDRRQETKGTLRENAKSPSRHWRSIAYSAGRAIGRTGDAEAPRSFKGKPTKTNVNTPSLANSSSTRFSTIGDARVDQEVTMNREAAWQLD